MTEEIIKEEFDKAFKKHFPGAIIIDGVNVAECEFLRKCVIPDNEGCKIDDSLCCDVSNCYYKQLFRLKQENQALRRAIKDVNIVGVCEELEKLKQENDKLKEDYRKATEISIEKLTISVEAEAYHKIKTALEEIREIAQYEINELTDSLINGGRYLEILDKINEVLK